MRIRGLNKEKITCMETMFFSEYRQLGEMINKNFEIFYGRPKKLLRFQNTLLEAL